tara:strand:- start:381 stop:650 length:270 start_codon:yes stop_codon:yes gene_type:complete
MKRAEKMLDECKEILKQRGEQYGDAGELYDRTSYYWTAFLGTLVKGKDVCTMMSLMKLARLDQTTDPVVKKDTYQDMINYIALAEGLDK